MNRTFKSKSLRKKTGRKPGGQKGHEGRTLEMVSDPNEIIEHSPEYCTCCGKDLSDTPGEFVERKQVVDLPPIKPVIIEHREISGQFNSWKGVENFMVLRSITDTALKNEQNVLGALNLIAKSG